MILPEKQLNDVRAALQSTQRPLYYYDDDCDGLCSFLLLYRFVREGKGVMLKTTSTLTQSWARHVDEYGPDSVFILDVPVVDQEFIDAVHIPLHWIDHHMPVERTGISYYNPRLADIHAYIPTTRLAYEIVQQDMWIAAVGCVADWYLPDFKEHFIAEYPDLMDKKVNSPEAALFEAPIGRLARIFSFILKGKTSDALKCVKILTRIETPYEILQGSTPAGKFILKRFEKINEKYETLVQQAMRTQAKDNFFIFTYTEDQWSFSSELSNELAYRNPDKVVLVCREKGGEFKCSLRAREKPILPVLQKALEGVEGHGGGHEHACGAVVKSEDFERFLKSLVAFWNLKM